MASRADTQDLLQNAQRVTPKRQDTCVMGMDPDRVAKGLGWFSIALGAAEILIPGAVARLIGGRKHRGLLRFYGLREVAAGVGLLTQRDPTPWLWARVAGDMVDLASLGVALADSDTDSGQVLAAIGAVAGVTALDVMSAQQFSGIGGQTIRAETSLLINRQPEECYRYWRDFENLPRFMSYLQSVRITGDRTSHWVARPAGNARVEWDAEIVEDVPGERISWRSLPGPVINSGSVEFESAPGTRGTVIRVQMDYGHPGQSLAAIVSSLMGRHPEQMINKDLRRFKQLIETGDVITTEGQPAGRTSGATWLDAIAR